MDHSETPAPIDPSAPFLAQLGQVSRILGPGLSGSLAGLELPPVHTVRQRFPRPVIDDVGSAVRAELARPEIRAALRPGARVCVAVGSRGIARIAQIVRALVDELKAAGTRPFLIPAMGSHGGATPEGQRRVLADYGITAETMGAEVVSSIEVREIGRVGTMPVYCSVDASSADAIIPVGRVKPHTGFRGPVESGLMKMMTIGLGKQKGADTLHAQGMDRFHELIPAAARQVLATQPIAFGLAIVENAYDEPAHIEAVLPGGLEAREQELLAMARANMPSLPFDQADVLVIQAIGKNISGSGMDPNVCARFVRSNGSAYTDHPEITHVAVLDLTPETHGNAAGIGLAELMCRRVLEKIDLASTYANCFTASHLAGAMLPVILESDRATIAAAIRTAFRCDPARPRLALIRNTLDVGELWVSPALAEQVRTRDYVDVSETAAPMAFDGDGSILWPVTCAAK